jgi:hypothetical protein
MLSVLLNVASTMLVYRYLGALLGLRGAVQMAGAVLFAVLPHNFALSISSFSHFSVAQPFLIVAAARLVPWCLRQTPRPDFWGMLSLVEAAIIGPEGWYLAICLGILALASRHDPATFLQSIRCPPVFAVVLATLIVGLAFPVLFRFSSELSYMIRGIDLVHQRDLMSGDLVAPNLLSFSNALIYFWVALGVYALWKRRFLMALLILASSALAFQVVRAFNALDLVGYAALMMLISEEQGANRRKAVAVLATIAIASILTGLPALKTSNFPPHLPRLAAAVGRASGPNDMIACSPAYGFLFQAYAPGRTTDDLHSPPGSWAELAELAALTPLEATRRMKEKQIRYVILTSRDFGRGAAGYWSSGGLNRTLSLLDEDEARLCLVMRALVYEPPLIKPLQIQAIETDKKTGERAMCLTSSP